MPHAYQQSMKHADDMVHPLLDQFAYEYYYGLPVRLWAEVGLTVEPPSIRLAWDKCDPTIRSQMRELAVRFMDGDETLALWRLKG